MLPIILDVSIIPIALIGVGEAFENRLLFLQESGCGKLDIIRTSDDNLNENSILQSLSAGQYKIVYVAGIDKDHARLYYNAAKSGNALVNVEDVKEMCDFHVPSRTRRGDVLITVSTGGRAAGLSKNITQYLSQEIFPPTTAEKFQEIIAMRNQMKSAGKSFNEIKIAVDLAFRGLKDSL